MSENLTRLQNNLTYQREQSNRKRHALTAGRHDVLCHLHQCFYCHEHETKLTQGDDDSAASLRPNSLLRHCDTHTHRHTDTS